MINRRNFLRGLGTAGCLAPFLPLTEAQAEESGIPTRLVLLFTPNGTLYENWAPTGTETEFTLGPILEPLERHKDQLVILDDVVRSGAGPGDMHQKGMAMLWSGSRLMEGGLFTEGNGVETVGWGGGITVDQHVANALAGGPQLFQSLELAVHPGSAGIWSRMCYRGPEAPVAPEANPRLAFDRLFGDIGTGEAELEQLRAERRSVIDVVGDQLSTLSGRISSADRGKLDAHLQGIREIERRNELALPTCDPSGLEPNVQGEDYLETSRAQIDNLVMALKCDLTRVASLQWSRSVSAEFGWMFPHGKNHHELSHLGDSDPMMVSSITEINRWYSERVAYLLDALAAVPEGNGSMLDNTLVVWGNELGRGNDHSNYPIPFVLAGGAGGRLQTGRWLNRGEQFHNRLLVSICHAMGLDEQDRFGDTDQGSGGFPDLLS